MNSQAKRGIYTLANDVVFDQLVAPEFISDPYMHHRDYDMVIAPRYVNGGGTDNNRILVWMSYFTNVVFSFVLGLNCKDVSNSFKLYRNSQLKRLNLVSDNFDIIEEIFFKIKRANRLLRVLEVPYLLVDSQHL